MRFTVINRFGSVSFDNVLRSAGMFVCIIRIRLCDSLLRYFCLIRLKLRDPERLQIIVVAIEQIMSGLIAAAYVGRR